MENNRNLRPITLEEHKKLQLDILLYVSDFCEKHQLRYSLSDGTLLGAIRHKGYIPWDDDIDICMPRPDLERLISIFDGNNRYKVLGPEDQNARYFFAKVFDTKTIKIEHSREDRNDSGGVDIDIFPIDGTCEDMNDYKKLYNQITDLYYRHMLVASGIRGSWKHVIQTSMFRIIYGNKAQIIKKALALCKQYAFDSSKYVAFYDLFSPGWRISRELFNEYVYTDFEGYRFRIMKGYNEVLTMQYGDYMTLPPEKDRVSHHLNHVYWCD